MGITNADDQKLKRAALVLRAINHKLRKDLFNHLVQHPKQPVTSIYRHFKIEQAVCSQHLAILRREGFVIAEREQRFVFYSANEKRFKEVVFICEKLAELN